MGLAGSISANPAAGSKPVPQAGVNQNPFAGVSQAPGATAATNAAAAGSTLPEETSSNGVATSKQTPVGILWLSVVLYSWQQL